LSPNGSANIYIDQQWVAIILFSDEREKDGPEKSDFFSKVKWLIAQEDFISRWCRLEHYFYKVFSLSVIYPCV
jgi:hypothetical protein